MGSRIIAVGEDSDARDYRREERTWPANPVRGKCSLTVSVEAVNSNDANVVSDYTRLPSGLCSTYSASASSQSYSTFNPNSVLSVSALLGSGSFTGLETLGPVVTCS